MNVDLKLFCILCLCLKSDFYFETKSHSVECFCGHHYLLSGCHEVQRLNRTNNIIFISYCVVPEEVSVTFDPEVVLNDEGVGSRSRYERFFLFAV